MKTAYCFAAAALLIALHAVPCRAQTLTGSVASAAEGAMEGVLVTAQKDGSPISTTVVSDASGHFRFPDGRLRSGHYKLRIRATGYELDAPQAVDLGASTANVAIKLRQTSDLAVQLTNTEWFMSMPGTADQKRPLIECMSCHTFERIVRSTYDADAFVPVLKRMAQYANNTTQARVQSRVAARDVNDDSVRKLAAYLATVNLSRAPTGSPTEHSPAWTYKLRTLPRPKGRATRVVNTEYDMPEKTIAPHD
ncbi:MAG: carboxypeptidase-like regulatory domain-containing protein, partial [Xanthobacteraceae bacterium]